MKISHVALEGIRKNPNSFSASSRFYGNMSQYRIWQFATREIHRHDISAAVAFLENKFLIHFVKNKENAKSLAMYIDKLHKYEEDYRSLGESNIEVAAKMNLDISNNVILGGEIARIDLNPLGGFSAYIFIKENSEWEKELRFPLIQNYIAKNVFNCPTEDVTVGVYCFAVSEHFTHKYSNKDLESALSEADKISSILSSKV